MNVASKSKGFSLIELMAVIAVIGLLTAIALPSYRDYLNRGKRAEGRAYLVQAAQRMERFYTDNNCYPSAGAACGNATDSAGALAAAGLLAFSGSNAGNSNYTIAVTTNAQNYTFTATPANGFTDARCGNLTLTNTGAKGASASGADLTLCWGR
jgi:type IV pilus assembly protein PilE